MSGLSFDWTRDQLLALGNQSRYSSRSISPLSNRKDEKPRYHEVFSGSVEHDGQYRARHHQGNAVDSPRETAERGGRGERPSHPKDSSHRQAS